MLWRKSAYFIHLPLAAQKGPDRVAVTIADD